MSSLKEYFSTDWAAMTATDWVGTILTVVIFVLMVVAYVYAYRPKNKEKLEDRKFQLDDGERLDSGEKNGG
ncbi:cbb3-type cytochrome c oxidase subunit 3 [Motiliproteus coralliicola]|uniref:Cbb3-type cytochrome c oxidase subunit 3 n=1 Tax=Motiliproteus coralliicola TaxID=2283196 RepID=A0A369WQD0_9GAMM|nr:cbb3-type cytochrome c oxidase subunit 3 [Motiliproteus coralliicola]RDE24298.1 cbb3-type cytochrome c oxidase subunit 3 [Motiliproteus coralliicola]